MKAVTKLSLLTGAAFIALVLPAASYAAPAATAAASATVQEVVVTADKREENLRDVPQSVTAISSDTLEVQRAFVFEDYITRVPGMNMVSAQAGSTRLMLRGINAGGVSATIGTYVDETPYGSVTALNNGAVLAPDLDSFDMQRLEVLRGPQGTLYGASSLGGLLKFVTNAPDPSHYTARIEVDGQGTESAPIGGSIKGGFNAPLGDKAAVRASAYYNNEPGFIDDPKRGAKNVNDATYTGVRLSFLANPTDKLSLRLSAVAQNIDSHGTSTEDVNRLTLQPLYGDLTQSRTFAQPNKVDYRIYSLVGDYDFGFANLVSATSYGTLQQEANQDATALYGALLTAIFKTPLGAAVSQDLKQDKFTQEVRLTSKAQKFEWLVGAFYTHEENKLNQALNGISLTNPPAIATGFGGLQTVSLPTEYTEYAAFANVDYHFTDQFDVSVGGRYSHNDQDSSQTTAGPLTGPTPSIVSGSSSEDVFTFAVAPKYKFNDNVTAYARVSKGYRPGGPNALSPLAPAAVPRSFESDSIIDYEAGIKGGFQTVSFEATAFYIDWSNIQLLTVVAGFGVNSNGGNAESKGIEGAVSWVPFEGLTLSANGAYIQANLTSDTGPLVGGKSGDRLPYAAPASGVASAQYTYPLASDMTLFMGADVRYTGRRRSDFNATFGQTSLPSYTAVDLHLGVNVRNFRAEGYVKNLGDERGILSYGGIGSTPNGAVQLGLIRPREIGVSLSANF